MTESCPEATSFWTCSSILRRASLGLEFVRQDYINAMVRDGYLRKDRVVREHALRFAHDPAAVLYINPPGFAKGYAKMFNTKGRIAWADPQIPEFEPKSGRADLYRMLMDAPPLVFFFRSKAPEPGYAHHAVFSVEKGATADYVLCSRPAEVPLHVKAKKQTKVRPGKLPLLPFDHVITADSQIVFHETRKEIALYYRDLFAHKLGVTRAERYYLATIDGYLFAVFGMFFANSSDKWKAYARGQVVYEVFGFTVPSKRYPRLNHLFMCSIVSEAARRFFSDDAYGSLQEFKVFQTTCISTTPEQKSHRATGLKLIEKRQRPDGRYHLVYAGPFRKETMAETIRRWLKMMENVERTTGKPMGVTMVPPGLITAEAA